MQNVMEQYEDAEFDYADVAVMALAERLNIRRIFTLDHRDFYIYRPTHCDHLELLP
jgi:predicted nucleic acid-binding protein